MTEQAKTQSAYLAGGCFWCTESDFLKLPGVRQVISGYTGGEVANPTYEQVCSGRSGHLEAVRVVFDPEEISYAQILDWFWRHIDPTDEGGQFVDRGTQYRSAIFYADEGQRLAAQESQERLAASGVLGKRSIVTQIRPLTAFYPAEDYHQGYCRHNPAHYQRYRAGSGRDLFLDRTWGQAKDQLPAAPEGFQRPSPQDLRARMTPEQYHVTQEEGTEPPFRNQYWDNKREGIYVDVVSGEPLFSSRDKYDSGTGWPSFSKPLEPGGLVEKQDRRLFAVRTEVRSRQADSHLGHVFPDGPQPTGLRYCMNSAALRFVPKEEMESQGYGQYLDLFQD